MNNNDVVEYAFLIVVFAAFFSFFIFPLMNAILKITPEEKYCASISFKNETYERNCGTFEAENKPCSCLVYTRTCEKDYCSDWVQKK